MRAEKTAIAVICTILLVLLSGCAGPTAPRGWLPSAREAEQEAFGAWISVEYSDGSSEQVAKGELIAVGQDSVFVLTHEPVFAPVFEVTQQLIAIPLDQIERGRLAAYDANHSTLAGWAAVGSLSTISHGWFVLASLPVWIIVGSVSTAAQSVAPIEEFPAHSWRDLRKYARFPQGLPEGLDRSTLRSKWK